MQKSTMSKDGGLMIKRPVVIGLAGVLIIFLLILCCAILISSALWPEGREGVIVWLCLFVGSLTAGMIAARKARAKRAASALVSGGVIFAAVLIVNILNRNSGVFTVSLLINMAIILTGSLLGSITSVKRPGRKRKRR